MKSGWNKVPLAEVLSPRNDTPSEEELTSGEVRIVSKIKFSTGKIEFRSSGETKTGMIRICPGDLVISGINAVKGAIAIYPNESIRSASATIHYSSYRVDESKADKKFLWWLLRSERFKKILDRYLPGGIKTELKSTRLLPIPVPLPVLSEQKRIVSHLDVIDKRLKRIQELRKNRDSTFEALKISLHKAASGDRVVSINEFLYLDEEKETILPDENYPQVGIRSFGKGLFTKPAVVGFETSYKAFNVLKTGKLVMSQVKGWEGAVAVCPSSLEGRYVSPEYRTFSCHNEECVPDYLAHIVTTEWFQKHLLAATRGVGARRERVRPEKLLSIEIPFPEISKQREAAKVLNNIEQSKLLSLKTLPRCEALLPSLLDGIFNRNKA